MRPIETIIFSCHCHIQFYNARPGIVTAVSNNILQKLLRMYFKLKNSQSEKGDKK